jgi:hypothetical protein
MPAMVPMLDYGRVCESKLGQWLFMATNLPFFACAIALAARGFALLGVVTAVVGFVSGGFHYYQCVDGQGSERVRQWLIGDMLAAAALALANVATASAWPSPVVVGLGTGAVAMLYVGTLRAARRDGDGLLDALARHESFYTATHGAWHLLVCAASSVFVLQSHTVRHDAPASPEAKAALSAATLLSCAGTGLFVLRGCPCGCGSAGGGGGGARGAAVADDGSSANGSEKLLGLVESEGAEVVGGRIPGTAAYQEAAAPSRRRYEATSPQRPPAE